jgi:hypothetical protein
MTILYEPEISAAGHYEPEIPTAGHYEIIRFRLLHGSPSSSFSRLLMQIVGSAFSAK